MSGPVIGKAFVDGKGRWTVHVNRDPIEPETRTRSGVVKTRNGFCYFRAARRDEIKAREEADKQSQDRADQFRREREEIAMRSQ